MTNVNRLTNGFYGLILFLGAALFLGCEKVPDYCGRHNPYEPSRQFCFDGKTQNKCSGGEEYNPLVEGCDPNNNNNLSTRCSGGGFAPMLGAPCDGYTLTAASAPAAGGEIQITSVITGRPVTLFATAAAGYEFAGWAGASSVQTRDVTLTMNKNHSIIAIFNPPSGTLAAVAFTPNGTTGGTVYINGDPAEETTTINNNATVTAMAVAADGYTFTGWSGALEGSEPTDVFTMNGGKTLVAEFTPNTYKFIINASPEVGGVVFVNDAAAAGIRDYYHGTVITLRVQPAEGYTFTGWTGAVTDTAIPLVITMNSGYHLQTLTANFAPGVWIPPNDDGGDGDLYTGETVKIGNLTWMAQNLNIETIDSRCYNNDPNNCLRYGRLYTWDAAMTACPVGWRLPANADWNDLFQATDGRYLKSDSGWGDRPWGDINTNEFGFSALPGGSGTSIGNFGNLGTDGYWWSTDEYEDSDGILHPYSMTLMYATDNMDSYPRGKSSTLSVRCVYGEKPATYTLTINKDGGGGASRVSSIMTGNVSSTHNAGANVTIRASANQGYEFTGWSGDGIANPTSANTTVSMTANRTVTANFQLEQTGGGVLNYGGESYPTVIIDGKRWMAKNLNYSGENGDIGVCYGLYSGNCTKYGRMYSWAEAMNISSEYNITSWNGSDINHQGVCPVGWHIPNVMELHALAQYIGISTSGESLKSETGWYYNGNGTDDYGFSALPGGRGYNAGFSGGDDFIFEYQGDTGLWWSATESGRTYEAFCQNIHYSNSLMGIPNYEKVYYLSVRCVQNDHP